MKKNGFYNNNQKISELNNDILTFFYKSGAKKAEGKCIDEKFEGKWLFYSEDWKIIQKGNSRNNEKNGEWKRYNKNGELEFHEKFIEGKKVKKWI